MIPETVRELVERYERNERSYRSLDYNEARLRQEFLNPFFKALGWDMENEQGWAEAYKDVVHEDSIDMAGHRKAPDYSFGIGKDRKFYVEAKKPLISVNDSKEAAFQLRSYAWSSKFSLSILTNFAEFAVYDCRFKPDMKDKPGLHRINYFKYTDYVEQWDLIASVFSRDAVLKGSFDKYAFEGKGKRGTEPVDEEFLKEIEEWRKLLARNIWLRNPETSLENLNFAVGKIIDRLLFLRICEDRKIEEYEQIGKLRSGVGAYMKMIGLFKQADDWYNAGLFHFNPKHKRAEGPDLLTPTLKVDDKILKGIIDTLYLPKSPYKFEKFPADILGQVYEQFLGKVIVKKGRTVDPVEKPEVKKAGGVYYTPTYIVDYIVEHTVGKLVEGKTPNEVAKLRVLDPACGSGSFLIGAYQYLLDWHLTYYEKQIKSGVKPATLPVYESAQGKWKLTLPERKRILLNNIYGVDIDAQAVEVTKLSLLLKVLEGENRASVQGEVKQHHTALPDLGNNIKCGNSLVAPDINTILEASRKRKRTPPTPPKPSLEGNRKATPPNPPAIRGGELREYPVNGGESELTEEEWHKINPFDWQAEFKDIFAQGGFDAVIGNPPYSYRNATEDQLRPYYDVTFKTMEGNYDLYRFFIEKATILCCHGGLIGQIVSASFLVLPTYKKLRSYMLTSACLDRIVPLGPGVFINATIDTCIFVLRNESPHSKVKTIVVAPEHPKEIDSTPTYKISQARFRSNADQVIDYGLTDAAAKLLRKIESRFPILEMCFDVGVGINTGYIKNEMVSNTKVDNRFHRMVAGSGISRYGLVNTNGWIMYDKEFVKSKGKLGRALPDRKFFDNPKILVVRTRNLSLKTRIVATIDDDNAYNLNRLSNIIAKNGSSIHALLGILNSTFVNWLFSKRYFDYEIKPVYLKEIPVATTNDSRMVRLVKKMLELNKKLPATTTPGAREKLERRIAATDREIDLLVYELYGLTEEEREIVEKDKG